MYRTVGILLEILAGITLSVASIYLIRHPHNRSEPLDPRQLAAKRARNAAFIILAFLPLILLVRRAVVGH